MTRDERRLELMEDATAYCCYCWQEQVGFGCCGENHFETFAQMSDRAQEDFLDAEEI